jgi:spore coat polysaccharide biosynthesis predicted glycosyltransferase SpsG
MIKICIITFKSKEVGLGNYKRSNYLRQILLKKYITKLVVLKNIIDLDQENTAFDKIVLFKPKVIIFDINEKLIDKKIRKIIKIYKKNYYLIGIDPGKKNIHLFNYNWISSLKLEKSPVYKSNNKIIYSGPSSILINFEKKKIKKKKNSILIIAGANDHHQSIIKIINIFEKKIKKKYNLIIIQGPYSKDIQIDKNASHGWKVVKAPSSIEKYLSSSEIVITRYGVSFFEALSYKCKIIFFTNNFRKEKDNIKYIIKNNLAIYVNNFDKIEEKMNYLKKLRSENYFFSADHNKKILLKFNQIIFNNYTQKKV